MMHLFLFLRIRLHFMRVFLYINMYTLQRFFPSRLISLCRYVFQLENVPFSTGLNKYKNKNKTPNHWIKPLWWDTIWVQICHSNWKFKAIFKVKCCKVQTNILKISSTTSSRIEFRQTLAVFKITSFYSNIIIIRYIE